MLLRIDMRFRYMVQHDCKRHKFGVFEDIGTIGSTFQLRGRTSWPLKDFHAQEDASHRHELQIPG